MWILGLSAALAFALSQGVKYYVVFGLGLIESGRIDVWPPFLTFRMGWNTGINFGLFSGQPDAARWFLIALSVMISVAIAIWAFRSFRWPSEYISAGILIGGALGNALDRLLYGAVADYLNMSCCGINNPFTFNVADIFIFAGAIGLVVFSPDKAWE